MNELIEQIKPLVRVICITYNHAKYIYDTMNGFTMQKTNFPYLCIIIDDASTDGEQAVIKKYIDNYFSLSCKTTSIIKETSDYTFTFAQHTTNRNCYFAVFFLKYNHYSIGKTKGQYTTYGSHLVKYTTFCEGDDYWIDPLKLQKQSTFLEQHSDFGMIYTAYQRYKQKEAIFVDGKNTCQEFNELLFENKIATNTVMLRTSLLIDYNEEIVPIASQRHWKMGDTPLWLYAMVKSKSKFLTDITGVYRQLENSACHFTSFDKDRDFWISHYDMSLFFAKRYSTSIIIQKKIALDEVEYLLGMAQSYNANLSFPFFKHLKENRIFSWQRYVSCKMRSSRLGRKLYSALKR